MLRRSSSRAGRGTISTEFIELCPTRPFSRTLIVIQEYYRGQSRALFTPRRCRSHINSIGLLEFRLTSAPRSPESVGRCSVGAPGAMCRGGLADARSINPQMAYDL